MKCEICGKDILKDSQCIDYKYYHNDCIVNLTKENQQLKEWKELHSASILAKENIRVNEENQKLKKLIEEKTKIGLASNHYASECEGKVIVLESKQKEFISYLENEKDRLAIKCSQTYEDSLGKTRFVNEDIFNEVDKILSKFKEIIGGKDE